MGCSRLLIRIALRSVVPLCALLASACSSSPVGSVPDGAVGGDVALADRGPNHPADTAGAVDSGGIDRLAVDSGGIDRPTADVAAAAPQDCAQTVGGGGGEAVLRFESEQPPVRVHLLRRYVRIGAGQSAIYELRGMWVEQGAAAARVCTAIVDMANLEYVNSHHNFLDSAAGTAAGVRYALTLHFGVVAGQGWTITLSANEVGSGRVVLAPVSLLVTGSVLGLNAFPSPGIPVHISELMADNTAGWRDNAGEYAPWIELFNPSTGAVDLSGYFLSNDPAQRRLWVFPPGTIIGRHQFMVIAADGDVAQGPLHTSFRLSSGGGSIVLTNPSGGTAGERAYPALPANRSALYTLRADGFEPSTTATPGAGTI